MEDVDARPGTYAAVVPVDDLRVGFTSLHEVEGRGVLLARTEEGGKPWEALRDFNEIGFAEWVHGARRTSGLHNDDVTLVHIDVW